MALTLLEQQQPEPKQHPAAWMRWERMRVRILEQRSRWSELSQRLAQVPATMPGAFRRWALSRRARALIFAGDYGQARELLRRLIWSTEDISAEERAQWRQLVMQSYLQQGRLNDAHAAMLRFHQDYGEGDEPARLMQIRILLAGGHPTEALSLLKGESGRTFSLLRELAQLRRGESVSTILQARRGAEGVESWEPLQRYLHVGVLVEAAALAGETAFEIIALERFFRLEPPQEGWGELFSFGADTLWRAYREYALAVGNREQMLLGDDAAWFELAEATSARYPVRRHALYALLTRQAQRQRDRHRAGEALAKLLLEQEGGAALVGSLFLDSAQFESQGALPPGVAYLLVDQAIRDGDLPRASALLQRLPEPPKGVDAFPWQLRRAKVFILTGDYAPAEALLERLVEAAAKLQDGQRDQLLQLMFDLQTVGEDERALRLLSSLYDRVGTLQLRRELLFWMADSHRAQERHTDAARLYLRSATLGDVKSMDPWAQTARYKAAQTLAKAGLLADAAHIYSRLLAVTEKPERRAVLRRELEQVRMRQAADE
ncbi:MAG: hypothetical protein ACQETD_04950, partial [Pseudomonadota bacterium]